MSNEKINAAATVAEKLLTAEERVSQAIVSVADLIAHMPVARAAVGYAHGVGHAAVTDTSGVLVQLSQAQGGLSAIHNQVAAMGRHLGLDISAFGPLQKEPGDGLMFTGARAQ